MKTTQAYLSAILVIFTFSTGCVSKINYHFQSSGRIVYTGLENFILGKAAIYRGKKAVLVTNHSGVDFNLRQNLQLLRGSGIKISNALAPEHGIYGYDDDVAYGACRRDNTTGLDIYNLYKIDRRALRDLLKSADIAIFDIQDMGMRCYTYITNLKEIMDAMKGLNIELIVLDRPNPVGFLGVDGAYRESSIASHYISSFPAPFLYGMTIGESALYYRGEFAPGVKLTVIRMTGYREGMRYYETGLPWVPPSPNLPTYESSVVYTAIVLMEGINLSLGRGTAKPFEYIGAPWIEPILFCKMLDALDLENFKFKPVYFKPQYNKYAGKTCGGAQIFYTGGNFSPTETAYRITSSLMKTYSYARWSVFGTSYAIDALAGTDKFRLFIQAGKSFEEYHKETIADITKFEKKRKKYLLY
jgi:uncharacterized protein YbbC (DUF1343 family)